MSLGVLDDFRCSECAWIFEARHASGENELACEECGGPAHKIYMKAASIVMRPDGWNLRPGEPGYSYLPKKDRVINSWQSQRTSPRTTPKSTVSRSPNA